MDESTSLLFGLEEFRVVDVQRVDAGSVRVVIETVGGEAACADCGLVSSRVKDRPVKRVKDLPASGQWVELRDQLTTAVARSNRSVADVASEYDVCWRTTHRALVAAAAAWLPEPQPTAVLGIDETRARTVRWILQEAGWRRSDPWMTSLVDADPTRPGRLLGLAPGRSGVCVADWLAAQTAQFRAAVEVVVIDPSAP